MNKKIKVTIVLMVVIVLCAFSSAQSRRPKKEGQPQNMYIMLECYCNDTTSVQTSVDISVATNKDKSTKVCSNKCAEYRRQSKQGQDSTNKDVKVIGWYDCPDSHKSSGEKAKAPPCTFHDLK